MSNKLSDVCRNVANALTKEGFEGPGRSYISNEKAEIIINTVIKELMQELDNENKIHVPGLIMMKKIVFKSTGKSYIEVTDKRSATRRKIMSQKPK